MHGESKVIEHIKDHIHYFIFLITYQLAQLAGVLH
jgi:hypothetical protein